MRWKDCETGAFIFLLLKDHNIFFHCGIIYQSADVMYPWQARQATGNSSKTAGASAGDDPYIEIGYSVSFDEIII